jgi:Sec-independent protein secretion pathway component TatC
MMIVMLPLYVLFEIGIVLARLAQVGRKETDQITP